MSIPEHLTSYKWEILDGNNNRPNITITDIRFVHLSECGTLQVVKGFDNDGNPIAAEVDAHMILNHNAANSDPIFLIVFHHACAEDIGGTKNLTILSDGSEYSFINVIPGEDGDMINGFCMFNESKGQAPSLNQISKFLSQTSDRIPF